MRTICFAFLFAILSNCSISLAQVVSFEIDNSKINRQLASTLDSLCNEDQIHREKLLEFHSEGKSRSEIAEVREQMKEVDSRNIQVAEKIIAEHGWLAPQDVGLNGSQCLFLMIQHADLDVQKKYFPMLKQAEREGKTFSSNIAILYDIIAEKEGRKQLYGNCVFRDRLTGKRHVYPVEDPDRLDARRKSMGLSPMKKYKKDWNLKKYKKMLPKIEKLVEEQRNEIRPDIIIY